MNIEKQKAHDRLKIVQKKIKLHSLYELPALIVMTFGLVEKFDKSPEAVFSFLADANVVNGLLAISIPWVVIGIYKSIKLSLELGRLKRDLGMSQDV